MGLLEQLRAQPRIMARCPSCDEAFRLKDARLFDATKTLPATAQEYLSEARADIAAQREELAQRRRIAKQRPRDAAESVNIGKVVEKVAPSLRGFPGVSGDYRSLFEPIDFIVFRGLATKGRVDAISFVDVKSGAARLTATQVQIRSLVESAKVSLLVRDHRLGAK